MWVDWRNEKGRRSSLQLSDRDWVMDRFIGHGKDCGFYSKGVTGSLEPGDLAYVVKIPMSMENCLWTWNKARSREAVPAVSREIAVAWSRVSAGDKKQIELAYILEAEEVCPADEYLTTGCEKERETEDHSWILV